LVREMAESQIDMTPECLVGWRLFTAILHDFNTCIFVS